MKKILVMLLGALLASLALSAPARGDEDVNIIIVDPHDPSAEVLHRDATQVPITCTVADSYLEVTFLSNLGSVSVEIENQTTGEYTQTSVNSAISPAIFPISGNAGFWTITFTLPDGTVYYGEFTI